MEHTDKVVAFKEGDNLFPNKFVDGFGEYTYEIYLDRCKAMNSRMVFDIQTWGKYIKDSLHRPFLNRTDEETVLILTSQAKGVRQANTLAKAETPLDIQVAGDHYKTLGIQPVEYIRQNKIGYFEGNVIKYVTRWKDKGGIKDLEKAKHYLEMLIHYELTERNPNLPTEVPAKT